MTTERQNGVINLSNHHYCSMCEQIVPLCKFTFKNKFLITICKQCEMDKYIEYICNQFTFHESELDKKIKLQSYEEFCYFMEIFDSLK